MPAVDDRERHATPLVRYVPGSLNNRLGPTLDASTSWLFDFFAVIYDHLEVFLQPPLPDALPTQFSWAQLKASREELDGVINRTIEGDLSVPPEVLRYLEVPVNDLYCRTDQEFLYRLFVFLLKVDHACLGANPFMHSPTHRPGLQRLRAQYDATRRLNKSSDGLVIFYGPTFNSGSQWWRRAEGIPSNRTEGGHRYTRLPRRGQFLGRYLNNLCRVPPISGCEIDFAPFRDELSCPRLDCDESLKIGLAPMTDGIVFPSDGTLNDIGRITPGPLVLRLVASSDLRGAFTVEIDNTDPGGDACRPLVARAVASMSKFTEEGVDIAVFPELVVPDPVVEAIIKFMKEHDAGPRLVVAGTFLRGAGPNGKPYNEAIVLGKGGEELWRQRKLHRYEMQPHEQRLCGLDVRLPKTLANASMPIIEDIATHPRTVTIRDGFRERYAVMICEDAGQSHPGLRTVEAFRVNFVFVPVMALALKPERSFAGMATRLSSESETIVVVANSCSLADAEYRKAGHADHPPLGVVAVPFWDDLVPGPASCLAERIPLDGGGFVHVFSCPARAALTGLA